MLADIQPLYADRSKIDPRSLELWNSLTPDMQEMLIPTKLQEGVWLIDGFNPEFLCATELDRSYESMSYGVCDSVEDIFNSEEFSGIVNGPEKVTIFLTEVSRADQPEQGGWRWHKWGPYIGSYEPQHEYLVDEDIARVFVFTIMKHVK